MGDSFQVLRGSLIRLSSRRVCCSSLTSSQSFKRMIPELTIVCSTSGAVVPIAVEDYDFADRREVGEVALGIHLRLFAIIGGRKDDDTEGAGLTRSVIAVIPQARAA